MARISSENERFRNALQSRPAEAIAYLYDTYSQSLSRYAVMITKDQETAKDIVQEAIVYIWANRKAFSSHYNKSIHHYLVKIVRSKSLSYFRKAVHLDVDGLPSTLHPINYSTIEVATVEAEVMKQIRDVITTFPKRERECLMMKIDDGMTPGEIAAHLRVSQKAVERAITSANKRLRNWAHKSIFA